VPSAPSDAAIGELAPIDLSSLASNTLDELKHLVQKQAVQAGKLKVDKVYFYWLTREQSWTGWFADTMEELAGLDQEGRLEITMHLTSAKHAKPGAAAELEATMMKLAQGVGHNHGVDLVSGIETAGGRIKTKLGRANWSAVFSAIAARHQGENVGVFFCGPPALENVLASQCAAHSSGSTRLKFFAENF
jgi:respiratory burst oxidase